VFRTQVCERVGLTIFGGEFNQNRRVCGLAQFLVPSETPGVSIEPMGSVDLTRRFGSVSLHDVRVSTSALLGEVGDEGLIAAQLRLALIIEMAQMVGALDKAFEMSVEWSFDRYTFGRPLASYQALKHRFADMKVWLEASHALVDAATRAVQSDAADGDEMIGAAKAYLSSYGPELVHECVQLHGGIGVTYEHDLHLYLRRVILGAHSYGTVREHRERLTAIVEGRERGR